MARFDKFNSESNEASAAPKDGRPPGLANGHGVKHESELSDEFTPPVSAERKAATVDKPGRNEGKKKRKAEAVDDATLAARLQAEEYSQARSTRGGTGKKSGPARKKKKVSVSSRRKIDGDEDSDLDSASATERKRKVNRSGGFHVRRTLLRARPVDVW